VRFFQIETSGNQLIAKLCEGHLPVLRALKARFGGAQFYARFDRTAPPDRIRAVHIVLPDEGIGNIMSAVILEYELPLCEKCFEHRSAVCEAVHVCRVSDPAIE